MYNKKRGQISVDAISYLLAISSTVIVFLFAGYSLIDVSESMSGARSIRLASVIGDTVLLNPELGMVSRSENGGRVMDHVIELGKSPKIDGAVEYSLSVGEQDVRKKEDPNVWCAKRAGVVNGRVEVVEVCV